MQHFTLQLDDDGTPQCTSQTTLAQWTPPVTLTNFVYVGQQSPNVAYSSLDYYTSNYTSNDVQFIDTWYFIGDVPIYFNSRTEDDTDGNDYVVSYKLPGVDELKPFFDLPKACNNASRGIPLRAHSRPQTAKALDSPRCFPGRQTRCCVYMLETDKGQLVFHNNVKSAPTCPPNSGRAALCNERCVSAMYAPILPLLLF